MRDAPARQSLLRHVSLLFQCWLWFRSKVETFLQSRRFSCLCKRRGWIWIVALLGPCQLWWHRWALPALECPSAPLHMSVFYIKCATLCGNIVTKSFPVMKSFCQVFLLQTLIRGILFTVWQKKCFIFKRQLTLPGKIGAGVLPQPRAARIDPIWL